MFMIREVNTEKYTCVIDDYAAISVRLDNEEYKPTIFKTIEDARDCINTLIKDKMWQIVVK